MYLVAATIVYIDSMVPPYTVIYRGSYKNDKGYFGIFCGLCRNVAGGELFLEQPRIYKTAREAEITAKRLFDNVKFKDEVSRSIVALRFENPRILPIEEYKKQVLIAKLKGDKLYMWENHE